MAVDEEGRSLSQHAWSPMEIDVKMRQVVEELDSAVTILRALSEASAIATHELKLAEARAYMQAKLDKTLTSAELRKAWVYIQTEQLQLAADLADGIANAQAKKIASLHHEADLLRSLARSSRDMHDSPGWGGRTDGR